MHGWPLRDRLAQRVDRFLAENGWSEKIVIDGVKWHLDLDDLACRSAYLDGCHEPETAFFLQRLIKPGNRLWDIGACHGFVSLRMARLTGAEGIVDAFEPIASNRARLDVNLRLNPELAKRISLHPYALSVRAGNTEMQRTSTRNPGASFVMTERPAEDKGRIQAGTAGIENVTIRPADSVWEEADSPVIQGIKIDVEGHEMQVLAGMAALVKRFPPDWFLVEVRDSFLKAAGSSKEELFAWFGQHGYVAQRVSTGKKLEPDHRPRNASAVLFLREEKLK